MSTSTIAALPQALGERVDIAPTVASLRELIVDTAQSADEARRMPQELVDALAEAGIFSTLLPREVGGLELHPRDFFDLVFELSRVATGVGWLAVFQSGLIPLMPVSAMRELRDAAGGSLIFAGSHAVRGRAVRVEGGYRFSGRSGLASGLPWADYITALAEVIGPDGEPETDASGQPLLIDGVVPRDEVNVLELWQSLGLRGTGSGQYELDDVFVPERFTFDGIIPQQYHDREIFARPWSGSQMAPVYLGSAQGAIDRCLESALRRRRRYADSVADGLRQVQLGEAEALVRSGRALALAQLERDFAESPAVEAPDDWEATAFNPVTQAVSVELMEPFIDSIQVVVQCTRLAKQVVNLVFDIAGTDSVVVDRGIERCLRDLYTAASHTGASYRHFAMRGEYLETKDSPEGASFTMPSSLQG